ncbi:short-chain dehydrogenase [Trichoderma cornu-damae]|uniref:Short-chain dehydrogenase n=1 Tax=Trichoderma cornu-damae TaxID=654480 RepID=A0A9P8QDN6_9HYPO|nr:short-chain dehydrogenase [Trichoderma cornu-damae]
MSLVAPYANEHRDTHGPGDARPTALKIVRDQGLDGRLSGKVVLVTGGTSGIGFETVRALHATGADVYFTGRDAKVGKQAEEQLRRDAKPGKLEYVEMSLDSLRSTREFAVDFLARTSGKLNILICNAGIRGYPKGKTQDGFELHFGTNHLGHFALFQALKDALISSSTPSFHSRVVCLTAMGHRQSGIRFDDINLDREGEYDPLLAYAQSKTANIYMAMEIERRFGASGVHGLAVHPGMIAGTRLNRLTPESQLRALVNPIIEARLKSAEQGAATTVWAAVARDWDAKGGVYLEDCYQSELWVEGMMPLSPGHAAHIHDAESAARLWDVSLTMVGLDASS